MLKINKYCSLEELLEDDGRFIEKLLKEDDGRRFIEELLKESGEHFTEELTKEDSGRFIEELLKDEHIKILIKEKILEKSIRILCCVIQGLASPFLEDVKKAQRILTVFEKNPCVIFAGRLYAKEMEKIRDDIHIQSLMDVELNGIGVKINTKFEDINIKLENFILYNKDFKDDAISPNIKNMLNCEVYKLVSLIRDKGELDIIASLIEAFEESIAIGTARKIITGYLRKNNSDEYWIETHKNHNERLLEVYMNILNVINASELQAPNIKRLPFTNFLNKKLSDFTLPGLVLLFIAGGKDKNIHPYIKSGYGEKFNILNWRKDGYILRLSSIAWIYNIFYLKHYICFNVEHKLNEKIKLSNRIESNIYTLEKFLKSNSSNGFNEIETIYDNNEKALQFSDEKFILNEYKRKLISDYEKFYMQKIFDKEIKVQYLASNSKKKSKYNLIDSKVSMCASYIWRGYEDFEIFQKNFINIDFKIECDNLGEWLINTVNKSNLIEELDKNELLDIKNKIDEFSDYINKIVNKKVLAK